MEFSPGNSRRNWELFAFVSSSSPQFQVGHSFSSFSIACCSCRRGRVHFQLWRLRHSPHSSQHQQLPLCLLPLHSRQVILLSFETEKLVCLIVSFFGSNVLSDRPPHGLESQDALHHTRAALLPQETCFLCRCPFGQDCQSPDREGKIYPRVLCTNHAAVGCLPKRTEAMHRCGLQQTLRQSGIVPRPRRWAEVSFQEWLYQECSEPKHVLLGSRWRPEV